MGRDLDELKPALRWLGREIEVHDSLDSTNLRAEQRAREGAPQGTIVLADRQTAGRGRLGRSFFSPGQRSLYLSVILRPACPPEEVHQAVFAAAVAVAETVRGRVPASVPVEIKWPNDVLLGGRKTSGINLPAHVEGGRVNWAILGIGLNVNTAASEFPAELREIATRLSIAAGSPLDRVAVAGGSVHLRLAQRQTRAGSTGPRRRRGRNGGAERSDARRGNPRRRHNADRRGTREIAGSQTGRR